MHLNRLNGFFVGGTFDGDLTMTIDEQNREIDAALDVRFAQINAAWEELEKVLKAMRPVTSVEVNYLTEQPENGGYRINYYLGFWKTNGQWKIWHGSECEPHDEYIDWTPINEEPVPLRIQATEHIDKLKEALVKSKLDFIPKMDKAITTLATKLAEYKRK